MPRCLLTLFAAFAPVALAAALLVAEVQVAVGAGEVVLARLLLCSDKRQEAQSAKHLSPVVRCCAIVLTTEGACQIST